MSENTALDKKLCAIMAEIETLPREGWNDYQKYHYTTDQSVSDLVRGLLAKHGVSVKVKPIDYEFMPHNNTIVVVSLEITLTDIDTGQCEVYPWFAPAQDKQDKGIYKAYTTGMKYFWMKQFVMSSGEADADSGSTTPQPTQQPDKKTTTRRPAAPKKNLANGEQKTRIVELLDSLKVDKAKRDDSLVAAGFAKMSELTAAQAVEAIKRMEAKLQEEVNGD